MNTARARLAAIDRHVISTRWGAVEYAERGSGAPVLVIHGIYHHCVGGLLSSGWNHATMDRFAISVQHQCVQESPCLDAPAF